MATKTVYILTDPDESVAYLTSVGGTGTAAVSYAITHVVSSVGTISVDEELLGAWHCWVGGTSDRPFAETFIYFRPDQVVYPLLDPDSTARSVMQISMADVESQAAEISLASMVLGGAKVSYDRASGVITIYKSDGTTVHTTRNAEAEAISPIVGIS